MLCYDPISGGNWAVKPEDGSVYANDGAPYCGALNNHPEWNANKVGTVYGIVAWRGDGTDANGNGYAIVLKRFTPAADGNPFAHYRFPRKGL